MTSYETIDKHVGKLLTLTGRARSLDAVETYLVLNSPLVKAMTCNLGAVWPMVTADAAAAWQRASSASTRIRTVHTWLAQSRDSYELLGEARQTWRKANRASEQMQDRMQSLIGSMEWEGASAMGQSKAATRRHKAQLEFSETVERLVEGCDDARLLTDSLMKNADVVVLKGWALAASQASRRPSMFTSVFALNSRLKAVAGVLEGVASDYEAIRSGSGWLGESHRIASVFSDNVSRMNSSPFMPRAV